MGIKEELQRIKVDRTEVEPYSIEDDGLYRFYSLTESRLKSLRQISFRQQQRKRAIIKLETTGFQCKQCGKFYPPTGRYFYKAVCNQNGLKGSCKKCVNKNTKLRIRADIKLRINSSFRSSIGDALKSNKNGRHWETLVDYTLKDLMKHLERQFQEGMGWDNFGKWHIDHIIPRAAFHFNTTEDIDFKRCWALTNLQPLWAIDNLRKSDRILKPFQPSLKITKQNTKGGHLPRW